MILNFDVLHAFKATEPISGRERRFEPGAVIMCDTGQTGPTVTIEADMSLFLVDRPIFESCCRFKNQGSTSA
jgi:hypothetical protein